MNGVKVKWSFECLKKKMYMISLRQNIVYLMGLIGGCVFVSCNGSSEDIKKSLEPISDSLIVSSDTLDMDTVVEDTVWHVFPSFDTTALELDTSSFASHSLDSLYTSITESVALPEESDSNMQIVGKWMVSKKIANGQSINSTQKVFAVYHQDSIFSMQAINVLGKWWIEDTLLFQKFELPTKIALDTSRIHVLNDSVLEVSEYRGSNKYVFIKVIE
ncbi:MAG: hypothetical protein CMP61_04530 [Flavobacteriales bacterium]|nr:hypothetical protein [Flavobacteriales bacterium]|tara:strand:+ start:7260 stop:7910 length:651 start_codon:yes stop_codon:yes gene_type:complete